MSFFPDTFNPRDEVIAELNLAELDTPDGPARFMIGTDGKFIDTNGDAWLGSQMISVSSMQAAIGGGAPEGSITLSYFQDPDEDNLIGKVRELGADYVAGRAIRFYHQPIRSQAEFMAPSIPPLLWATRTMRTITFTANGAQDRSMTLTFEAWTENRRAARRIILNTEGHAKLIGEANPSLEMIPTTDFEEEKLFG